MTSNSCPAYRRRHLRSLDVVLLDLISDAGVLTPDEFVSEAPDAEWGETPPSEETLTEWWNFSLRRGFIAARTESSDELALTDTGRAGLTEALGLYNFADLRTTTKAVALWAAPGGATAVGALAAVAKNATAAYVAAAVALTFVAMLALLWILTKLGDLAFAALKTRVPSSAVSWLNNQTSARIQAPNGAAQVSGSAPQTHLGAGSAKAT